MTRKAKVFLEGEIPQKEELSRALYGIAKCDRPLLFEISLCEEDRIQTLNRTYRKIDKVTDVLSFPSETLSPNRPIRFKEHISSFDEEEKKLFLGSVAICLPRAKEQAKEFGHSLEREICYLAVHGVLHCLGYDHEAEEDRKKMREKEESVLKKLGLGREE